jgi:serine/threonine protein kinase
MIGETISHYRIVSKLGEGGMGVVYKAEDTRLDRTVALKFLGSHLVTDQDGRRRFIREAKAAAALDHPNICTIYEIDEVEGRIFIAMAYLEGSSLTELIAAGPLKLPEALDIARQAARGLQEAHSKGIVHRDIKPANIMAGVTSSGERLVKIMDFGLAQLSAVSKLTRADTTLGTICYMSPEQTQGTTVDPRSDVWSLGAVLYELVTAQQPFKGHYEQAVMYSILNEEPPPITSLRAGVPMELEWIVGKALAKLPDRRYQSALEFCVDLETLLAKMQAGGATMAGSAFPAAPAVPRPQPLGAAFLHSEPPAATAETHAQQRRRTRDLLLQLGGQGLLPDRVLSQALDLLGKPPEQMPPDEKRRATLLESLLYSRIRVGEFIEQWQPVESLAPAAASVAMSTPAMSASAAAASVATEPVAAPRCPKREWRTRAEILGLPLLHYVRGCDPVTGKRCVAKGIVALGEIAIGVIACGGIAAGPLAIGFLSLGLLAAGGIAIGLLMSAGIVAAGPGAFGAVSFPLDPGGFVSITVRAALAFLVLRLLVRRRRFRKEHREDGGIVSVWSIFGGREWRSDGTPFRGGHVVATLGGCDVDLSGTTIDGPEAVIEATAMLGGIKIIVPYGWRIVTQGSSLFGGYGNKTRPPQAASAATAPRLIVKGFALCGGVEVTHPKPGKQLPGE